MRKKEEQLLTASDIRILSLLAGSKGPVKMGEICRYLGKYHQRTKDRIKRLLGFFIKESDKPHSKREKPYELIESEREFVEQLIKKFGEERK